jgi:ketosteroid isomerase-like protein
MKKLFYCLLAIFYAASPVHLAAQSASEEMSIRTFTREYMTAYNRQDITALVAMHTADAIAILERSDTVRGGEALAKRYEDRFIRYEGTLLMRHMGLNWSDEQQAWVAVGTYEGYGATYVYDIPYHRVTAYANTMVEENGRWKIARSVVTSPVRTLVYQEVEDFSEWNSVLRGFLHQTNVLTHEIGTLQNAPGTAYALLQWPSLQSAQEFFAGTSWQNTLKLVSKSDIKLPVVLFLDK